MSVVWTTTLTVLAVAHSALGAPELPLSYTTNALPLDSVAVKAMPALDYKAIALEDVQRQAAGEPLRFAIPNQTQITPFTDGTWEKIDANTMLWRLRITAPNAVSLNLGFTRFTLPDGAALYIYNNQVAADIVRPITKDDNRQYNQFWTPVVVSNDVTIELVIPETQIRKLDLTLGSINLGYWDFTNVAPPRDDGDENALANTGGCEIDTICPQGDAWRAEIQSVARIVIQGQFLCTGWMTNNTANDKKNYFITANHCGLHSGNAGSLVTFWNYFNSFCRPTSGCGNGCVPPGNGSQANWISGSTFRASYGPSDFTLVELSSTPPPAWQVSYAGWDRSGGTSPNGAGIHHPQGEDKRICLYTSMAYPTFEGSGSFNNNGDHVIVGWSSGVTEGGSSGSPLFDTNKRAIGQLHSGLSFCTNPSAPDWYGRFFTSWTGGGSNSSRLSNWLDPLGTGATVLNTISGLAPANDTCINAVLMTSSVAFNTTACTSEGFNEPNCGFSPNTQIDRDIWYKWIATCTGTATFSVCGATFNTRLALYAGCPGGAGATLACDDNNCGLASQMTFHVNQGSLYRIRVGGFSGASGTGTLAISCVPDPPSCPEDVNNSGTIDIDDLVIIITNWGSANAQADVNNDNIVNIDDLVLVITAWGPC